MTVQAGVNQDCWNRKVSVFRFQLFKFLDPDT
jgi:hypothetical protein